MPEQALPYDPADKVSIVLYAKQLIGKTLRQAAHLDALADPKTRRS